MVFKCPIVPSKPRAQLTPKAADIVLTKLPLGEPQTISFGLSVLIWRLSGKSRASERKGRAVMGASYGILDCFKVFLSAFLQF